MIYEKNQFESLNLINYNEYPRLENSGSNDDNGYQIFTPKFIVDEMISEIGLDYIENIFNKVLEPASGDGAFTVRILEARLIKIIMDDKINYLQKSLIALSNIYSIEMDQELLFKQRNNIFTLLNFIAKEHSILLTKQYLKLAELIIKNNIIWGETNVSQPHNLDHKNGILVGWYMPTEIKVIVQVPVLEKIEYENLLGEKVTTEASTNEMVEKIKYTYRRTKTNQIKFSNWLIDKDLFYKVEHEKIEVD